MAINMKSKKTNNHFLSLNDVLVLLFVLWPLFWNLYNSFKITVNSLGPNIPVYVLWILTLVVVIANIRFKASYLLIWFIFIGAVLLISFGRFSSTVFTNMSVLLCCALYCIFLYGKPINTTLMLRCIFICGIFIVITIFADLLFNLFQKTLISLYTYKAATVKNTSSKNSGILTYTSSAGGYVCMGLASYIALLKLKGKKWEVTSWIVIGLFVIAFFVLRKRGFTLDMVLSFVILWFVCGVLNKNSKMDIRRSLRIFIGIIALVVVGVILYNVVPVINNVVGSFLERFTTDDETLSGRTQLYALAWKQFTAHPVFGIGWGNYRGLTYGIYSLKSDKTYAAHNVYLQLMCEIGIVGALIFVFIVVFTLIQGFKRYKYLINRGSTSAAYIVQCGLFFELFFLTYCISGNPLYDYNFLAYYFIGILLTLSPENNPKVEHYLRRFRR